MDGQHPTLHLLSFCASSQLTDKLETFAAILLSIRQSYTQEIFLQTNLHYESYFRDIRKNFLTRLIMSFKPLQIYFVTNKLLVNLGVKSLGLIEKLNRSRTFRWKHWYEESRAVSPLWAVFDANSAILNFVSSHTTFLQRRSSQNFYKYSYYLMLNRRHLTEIAFR